MKVDQYIKSLLPSLSKIDILEDARAAIGETKETVIPAYKQGAELFKNWKFKTVEAQEFNRRFLTGAERSRNNLVVTIEQALPTVVANMTAIEELIKKTYSEDVAASGITYLKAQLLQAVEAFTFFNRYARAVLNHFYVVETASYLENKDEQYQAVRDQLTPAQTDYVKQNLDSFITVFNAFSHQTNDLKKKLMEIPEIVVTSDNVDTLGATAGKKLDPMLFGLIPVRFNPIYHIGMKWAEWQVERYYVSKQELQMLQMRKLNLELTAAGKADAKLQKEIDYTSSRIQGLQAKIAKMEHDYA